MMPFYRSNDTGSFNRWKHNVGVATSRRMERTRCPKCGRGGAIKTTYDNYGDGNGAFIHTCRWNEQGKCDYEEVRPYCST